MTIKSLEINSKTLHLMKAVTNADYNAKTVLTNSAWEYVELWLKRKKQNKEKGLFFTGNRLIIFIMHQNAFLWSLDL